MRVVMLLTNSYKPDPRVACEASALVKNGYHVTVLSWDRQAELPERETSNGIEIVRVQNVHSAYGAGWRQLLYLPRFLGHAVRMAVELQPDIVHCHDLDTLPAGWWLKGRFGARLVYDAHEDYPAVMSLYLPTPMVAFLSWLERRLLGRVDYTITASTVFADKLSAQGVAEVTTIGNYQPLEPFDAISQADIAAARARLGLAPSDFVMAYIGGFSRDRQLLPLIEAARRLSNVQILLWGDGHQKAELESAAAQVSNVRYLGWLPADQVPLHMRMVDAIYYCLVTNYPGAVYNAPNTLSGAMAAARPIVANDVGDLGRIVRQTGCGLLLATVTPHEICQALETLRDPAVRQRLGEAGRKAMETYYNWTTAEQQLIGVYARLRREG